MRLILKARVGLTAVKKQITRGGKTFQQTVYIRGGEKTTNIKRLYDKFKRSGMFNPTGTKEPKLEWVKNYLTGYYKGSGKKMNIDKIAKKMFDMYKTDQHKLDKIISAIRTRDSSGESTSVKYGEDNYTIGGGIWQNGKLKEVQLKKVKGTSTKTISIPINKVGEIKI